MHLRDFTYALILAASLAYPLLKSFEYKLRMWEKWRYMIPSILLAAIPFLIWDVYFAIHGIWGFNPDFVTGFSPFGLPWEEWLFFVVVPYACFFIYEVLNYFFPKIRNILVFNLLHWTLFMVFLYLGFKFADRVYTTIAFFSAAFALGITGALPFLRPRLPRFYLAFFVSLIPFFLVNGLLTYLPIVVYNDTENLGLRLVSIPVEDAVYLLTLLFLNFGLYEWMRFMNTGLRKLETATGEPVIATELQKRPAGEGLRLQVSLHQGSGFCSGVSTAIRKAEEVLDRGGELFCLGEIIHNEQEIKRLEDKGMQTISHEELEGLHGQNILFRAHGEPPATYRLVEKNNNILIDASCNIVLHLQQQIRAAYLAGEQLVIFGKQDHPEVKGLLAQCEGHAVLLSEVEDVDKHDIKGDITLFSQTTRSRSHFLALAARLEEKGVRVHLRDTICKQISGREEGLRAFSAEKDVVLFVAGQHSSNGKALYEVCRGTNPRTFLITSLAGIDPAWFKNGENVGIAGASSTPGWLLAETAAFVRGL